MPEQAGQLQGEFVANRLTRVTYFVGAGAEKEIPAVHRFEWSAIREKVISSGNYSPGRARVRGIIFTEDVKEVLAMMSQTEAVITIKAYYQTWRNTSRVIQFNNARFIGKADVVLPNKSRADGSRALSDMTQVPFEVLLLSTEQPNNKIEEKGA